MTDVPSESVLASFPLPERPLPPAAPLTVDERAEQGRAARLLAPWAAFAEWTAPTDRPDPIDLLEAQAKTRVAELMPIRYGRMSASPFAFFRGSADIFAADIASLPRTGLQVQLCGDAHLANFGTFMTPDRQLVFTITDFDETLPGPFEWDLLRLTASVALVGHQRGVSGKRRRALVMAAVRAYREAMIEFAEMRNLHVWYARLDLTRPQQRLRTSSKEDRAATGHLRTELMASDRLTQVSHGQRRIVSDPPLVVPLRDFPDGDLGFAAVDAALRAYRRTLAGDRRHLLHRFHLVDAARKVVGIGSVGTRDWIVLLLGRDIDDPFLLQVKQASASVLEPYLGASAFASHGQRVVEGQRLTQAARDIMLGWMRLDDATGIERDYYVRQLWDTSGPPVIDRMKPKEIAELAELCGMALALGHARSGDPVAIASYLGAGDDLDRALAIFAETYAGQVQHDYDTFLAAIDAERIPVRRGV